MDKFVKAEVGCMPFGPEKFTIRKFDGTKIQESGTRIKIQYRKLLQ